MSCLRARRRRLPLAFASSFLLACGASPPEPRDPETPKTTAGDDARPPARALVPPRQPREDDGRASADARSRSRVDASATTDGEHSGSNADRVLASLRPAFRDCYQAGLRVDPHMQGRVLIRTQLSGDGVVMSNEVIERKGLSSEVAACLADVVRRAPFDGAGGSGSTLNIPVTFEFAKSPR